MKIAVLAVLSALCTHAAAHPAAAQTARKPAQPVRATMTILVTDLEGTPVPEVWVRATGPVEREAATDDKGSVSFSNMTGGTYRLRFEHDDFVMLEREVTHGAKPMNLSVALNAAPPKPAEPERATPPPADLPPAGAPTVVSIPDFFERNYVGSAPSLVSQMGCVPGATARLLQLRDPLTEHTHADADELLYVVAGEGTHRIAGSDVPLAAGVFATVPRNTPHSITRRGRNPIIVLSIVTEPCEMK